MKMPLPEREYFTYQDYASWTDDKRWELIDGEPYLMSPAPTSGHQRIQVELTRQFANHLEGRSCEAFSAPFDVRLNADGYDDTVVQPDLTVVCDPSKIDDAGCRGVPDMVVEIISKSTARRDRIKKFDLYQRVGVKEYWIVEPEARIVEVYLLENGKYVKTGYEDTGSVEVKTLPGLAVDLAKVFGTAS